MLFDLLIVISCLVVVALVMKATQVVLTIKDRADEDYIPFREVDLQYWEERDLIKILSHWSTKPKKYRVYCEPNYATHRVLVSSYGGYDTGILEDDDLVYNSSAIKRKKAAKQKEAVREFKKAKYGNVNQATL